VQTQEEKQMTKLLTASIVALILVTPAIAASASDEDEISRLEEQRAKAVLAGDVSTLSRMYGDDWFYNLANGQTVGKAEYLKRYETGELKVHQSRTEDVRIRVYGDAAVVTGVQHVNATVNGKDIEAHLRYLHVFAKPNGQWVVVARQATYLSPPK